MTSLVDRLYRRGGTMYMKDGPGAGGGEKACNLQARGGAGVMEALSQ
jgi:hypothetical protein